MRATLQDKEFKALLNIVDEGDAIEVDDASLVVEGKFDVPTHFPFHQRIFPPGILLKVKNRNTRIFFTAEELGWKPREVKPGYYDDRQIKDGIVLPADKGTQYNG